MLTLTPSAASNELLELSLEELMNLRIIPAGSLTMSSARLSPSTVTTITQADIQASGARSLNELLDIYAPNLQMIRHHWEARHLGLRGIIRRRGRVNGCRYRDRHRADF